MEIEAPPEKPLLWVLRENLGLNGTKFGCGIGQCGACTVHIDGIPIRSCSLPVSAARGRNIRTIEGLKDGDDYHPIQAAWDSGTSTPVWLLPIWSNHVSSFSSRAEP